MMMMMMMMNQKNFIQYAFAVRETRILADSDFIFFCVCDHIRDNTQRERDDDDKTYFSLLLILFDRVPRPVVWSRNARRRSSPTPDGWTPCSVSVCGSDARTSSVSVISTFACSHAKSPDLERSDEREEEDRLASSQQDFCKVSGENLRNLQMYL